MTEKINELIEMLEGTCMSTLDACEELGIDEESLTSEDYDIIDNEIFLCESCGWWFAICDVGVSTSTSDICINCAEEEDEEECQNYLEDEDDCIKDMEL